MGTLHRTDCRDALRAMADDSIDSIVTDPPYELGFMGKSWDATGIAYDVEMWRECLRVLKPGGHLLAFGATRTYHRLACAIEDAGFEIRDQINFLYGSGYPHSLDVGKAIDRAAGAEREVVAEGKPVKRMIPGAQQNSTGSWVKDSGRTFTPTETLPATDEAKRWDGWGTSLKPAHEPIVVARKPLIGSVAENVLAYGTGAINVDGSRVELDSNEAFEDDRDGEPSAGRRYKEAGVTAFSPLPGRRVKKGRPLRVADYKETNSVVFEGRLDGSLQGGSKAAGETTLGRFPANVIIDGSPELVDAFPTSGPASKASGPTLRGASDSVARGRYNGLEEGREPAFYGDEGSVSRFFKSTPIDGDDAVSFYYCSKPSQAERHAGMDGGINAHPTLKPLALIRYLVTLVTPPGGTVFDPFIGSGTTACAAILEGFEWVGCDITETYWPIIEARVRWAERTKARRRGLSGPLQAREFGARKPVVTGAPSLFDHLDDASSW